MDATNLSLLRDLQQHPIGGYHVEEFIDAGGTAAVFRARRGGASVALKVFTQRIDSQEERDEQEERIKRAVAAAATPHRNIVRVFDGGRCKRTGHLYLVMELVTGATVASMTSAFPIELATSVTTEIADAAHHLEELGLVHRDIKPSNVMLRQSLREAVLLDLGVVRPLDQSDLTATGAVLATKRYSPPELFVNPHLEGVEAWRAVTYYQLGGLLHDMLMRRRLFNGLAGERLIAAIKSERPVIDKDLDSPALSRLARLALAKSPADRLASLSWDSFRVSGSDQPDGGTIDYLDLPGPIQDVELCLRSACTRLTEPISIFITRSRRSQDEWSITVDASRKRSRATTIVEFFRSPSGFRLQSALGEADEPCTPCDVAAELLVRLIDTALNKTGSSS